MDKTIINTNARSENIRALMVAAGLSEEEAASRLDSKILITYDNLDQASCQLINEILPILGRTLEPVWDITGEDIAAELVLGYAKPRSFAPYIFATLYSTHLSISPEPISYPGSIPGSSLMTLISACYATSAVIYCAVGQDIPNPPPRKFDIKFSDYLPSDFDFTQPINIGEAYLAGAGAIGNGFLWAARHVSIMGRLHVADDDAISDGNLQRQIWFLSEDIGEDKAEILCRKAQPYMPDLALIPSVSMLQDHENRNEGPWLERLIVAADSRPARRKLQNELPGEVFDASTTGSKEIVLHYNKQPTDLACLGCVYSRDKNEISHEEAVAEHLGIAPADLRADRISPEIANIICDLHSQLKPEDIAGLPFDTLYKQLCSADQLKMTSGEQVVAPFAFVSVLAGALLLLEIIQKLSSKFLISNEWRVNPWMPLVPEMRLLRPKNPDCECCGRSEIQEVNKKLWPNKN